MEALNLNPGDPNYFIRSEDRKTFKEFKDKKAKATCAHLSLSTLPLLLHASACCPAKIVSHLPMLSWADVPLLTGQPAISCAQCPHWLERFSPLSRLVIAAIGQLCLDAFTRVFAIMDQRCSPLTACDC